MFALYQYLLLAVLTVTNAYANTSTVLMVPPVGFRYNQETAQSNHYQKQFKTTNLSHKVMAEFQGMVNTLNAQGINTLIYKEPSTLPDAVFPNNWFSTHINSEGATDLLFYPMLTTNRQAEVNPPALTEFLKNSGIKVGNLIDLREKKSGVLEGTGSMVLDRNNKIIYASLSERTSKKMVIHTANILGYKPIIFNSVDDDGYPIYHTNVIMGLGQQLAVVCLSCIKNPEERKVVQQELKKTGKKIIDISSQQVKHMCGNVLELVNKGGDSLLVMSQQAYSHFTQKQKATMQHYDKLVPVDIITIETIGGGSARCMLAEIYNK